MINYEKYFGSPEKAARRARATIRYHKINAKVHQMGKIVYIQMKKENSDVS